MDANEPIVIGKVKKMAMMQGSNRPRN
ncbi:uncharacterized protein METZ01_LOCUS104202, partial [marine metagenome]